MWLIFHRYGVTIVEHVSSCLAILICRDNPPLEISEVALIDCGWCRVFLSRMVLDRWRARDREDRSDRTWYDGFAGHEDLHAPEYSISSVRHRFFSGEPVEKDVPRSTLVLHESLRVYDRVAKTIQRWKRNIHVEKERKRKRKRKRERERESREGARDEVTRPCAIPTIRLIIIPNRFANTATRAAKFHRFLRISLLFPFLFRLLPLTHSPSFVILSARQKSEYISCVFHFFFWFSIFGYSEILLIKYSIV